MGSKSTGCSIFRPCVLPICENKKFKLVHKFPSDNAKAKKWLDAITLNGNNPIPKLAGQSLDEIRKKYLVCYQHFKAQDYKNMLSRGLNTTAIPSINLSNFNDLHLVRKLPDEDLNIEEESSNKQSVNLNAIVKPISQSPSFFFMETNNKISPITSVSIPTEIQKTEAKVQNPRATKRQFSAESPTIRNFQYSTVTASGEEVLGKNDDEHLINLTDFGINLLKTAQQTKRSKIEVEEIEITEEFVASVNNDLLENPQPQPQTNKLMALFEVTPEQYSILNRKLQNGNLTDDFFNLKDDEIAESKDEMAQELLELVIDDERKIKVDAMWLRDHCRCAECFNSETFQRKLKITDIPDTIAIESYQYSNKEETVEVTWNDGHQSKYSLEFLLKYNYDNLVTEGDIEKPFLWTANDIEGKPARVDYRDYLIDDDAGKQVVRSLVNYGVAFVEKVPANAQQTEFVIRKLFPVHKTLFGEMWTFSDSMDHRDTAYTKEFLGPHNDNTYFNDASGLQILHCIFHEGTEGETFLVDGFQVCEKLRAENPDVFKRLCETVIPAEYVEEGKHHKYVAPIIKVNPVTDQLEQVRYNLYDRAPFDSIPMSKVRQFYKDLRVLTNEMDKRDNQWWFKLNPGTVMIFDNWRVLHARNHYTGKRTMTGCYVARSEFMSVARTMNFIR